MPTDCPSRDTLQIWLDKDDVGVSHHVDTCADCQGTVETLLHDCDTFLNSFRDVAILAADSDPSQRVAIDSIKAELAQRLVEDQQATDEPDEWIGRTLGNYRIEALLGKGGMGRVYRAQHVPMQRTVAIKLLLASRASQQQAADRFVREWVASAKVSDPNVVLASDAGEINGVPYLVLEHLDGINLRQLHKVMGQLSVSVACELVRQAASGLAAIHQAGLVHRDIKPSNLMLTSDGLVKILDLGLARLNKDTIQRESDLTESGIVLGTMQFMAPEQCSNPRDADVRADLYSLGCTLYFLLTGNPPFHGPKYESAYNVMQGHVAGEVPSVTSFRDDIPDGLLTILDRLLAKSPGQRFESPAELVEAITPFAAAADLGLLIANTTTGTRTRHDTTAALLGRTRTYDSPEQAVTSPSSIPSSFVRLARRLSGRSLAIASIALFAVIVFGMTPLGKQTIRIVMNRGEVVIQDAAPNVKVVIRQNDIIVKEGIGQRFDLRVGNYDLALLQPDGVEIHSESFQITRGGRKVVALEYMPIANDETSNSVAAHSSFQAVEVRVPQLSPLPADDIEGNFGPTALVTSPAKLPGVRRWTIETTRPRGEVNRYRFSPDGAFVATGGSDGSVRIYREDTFELTAIFPGLRSVTAICWSPDNAYIAAGDAASRILVWQVATGQVVRQWDFGSRKNTGISSLAWSPVGNAIAAGVPGQVVVIGLESSSAPTAIDQVDGGVVAWSRDGQRLASVGTDGMLKVRESESGRLTAQVKTMEKLLTNVAWSADGRFIVTSAITSGTQVWDDEAKLVAKLEGGSVAWSADGSRLITTDSKNMRIWNTSTWKQDAEFRDKKGTWKVGHPVISNNGDRLVYGRFGESDLCLVDLDKMAFRYFASGFTGSQAVLAWDTSASRIATAHGNSGELVLFDPASSPPLKLKACSDNGAELVLRSLSWSPDGDTTAICGNGTVGLVGTNDESFHVLRAEQGTSAILDCSWSETGLATRSMDGSVVIWDTTSHKVLHNFETSRDSVGAITWSRDGRMLAFGAQDVVQIWDRESDELIELFQHEGRVAALAWSPDSQLLCFNRFGAVYVRTLRSGVTTELRRADSDAHDSWVWSIQWLPDGRHLATHGDTHVRIWDALAGELTREIAVTAPGWLSDPMAVSADGDSIAVCGEDRTVRIWKTRDGEPILNYTMLDDKRWLVVAPDGNWTGSEGISDSLVYLVETDLCIQRLTQAEMQEQYGWRPEAGQTHDIFASEFGGD